MDIYDWLKERASRGGCSWYALAVEAGLATGNEETPQEKNAARMRLSRFRSESLDAALLAFDIPVRVRVKHAQKACGWSLLDAERMLGRCNTDKAHRDLFAHRFGISTDAVDAWAKGVRG